MNIIDLTPENEHLYFCCLEEWSDEIKEAGNHKACWYNIMKDRGLRVKLARNEEGVVCGMIQYLPVEESFAEGNDLYMILCIWVHGHKEGIGNHQKKGAGKALLKAAEEDVKSLGSGGIAAWGLWVPVFMRAAWFRKHGYKIADRDGLMRLLWKPFRSDAKPPSFIKRKKTPEAGKEKVNVSLFLTGWCPAQNMVYERTKRAMSGFEDYIVLNDYSTLDKKIHKEWGISDAVFIDSTEIRNGPPTPYRKIRQVLEKKIRRKVPS